MNKQAVTVEGDLPKYGGTRDRKTGTIRAIPVPETAAARLVEFVESNATPDSQKFTEAAWMLRTFDT